MMRRFRLARLARSLAGLTIFAVLGLCVGVVAALTVPRALGYRSLTVLTGSMEPAISPGDLVIGRQIAARSARPGDVVTFEEPGGTRLITHRVVSARPGRTRIHFVTLGDANDTSERWKVPLDGRIARVEYRLPKAGYVLSKLRAGPRLRLLGVLVPVILVALYELLRIWRPERKPAREAPV